MPYLTFTSIGNSTFTIQTNRRTKNWNGTLWYSRDARSWTVWDGSTIISSSPGRTLYLRGKGNTVISGQNDNYSTRWVFSGATEGVSCEGNIETLLDYEKVLAGQHPTMANYCFYQLFYMQSSLKTAPELPAMTLSYQCYYYMFYNCGLTVAPALPATTLAGYCYSGMFANCAYLTAPPALPATTLAEECYSYMFHRCAALTTPPRLPATRLATSCYAGMFMNSGLTSVPALPATALPTACYSYMFNGCSGIKINNSSNVTYSKPWRIPANATITSVGDHVFDYTFQNTGGAYKPTSVIVGLGSPTTLYLSGGNGIVS